LIDALIASSLKNRALVLFLALLLVVSGAAGLTLLPMDAVPDVTNVQVQINTESPGLAPLEVERLITFPIEQAMAGLPRIAEVRSLSKYGLSQITVVFEEGTDIYFARRLVIERLGEAREQIPEGLGNPQVGPISTGLGEIYQYEVRGPGRDLMELRDLQDWVVRRLLRTVPGVTEVNTFGGQKMQYQVLVDPVKLRAYGLTFRDVLEALRANNRNAGGGFLEYRGEQYLIRSQGLVKGERDIGDIVLAEHRGTPVCVRDVARVLRGPAPRQGAVTRDGRGEVVTGVAMMLVGANSRTVARDVDARVADINRSLPPGVRLETFYDRTDLVNRTLKTVATNLVEGALLVVVVLIALLGDLRAALTVALVIPLSMLFASLLMLRTGVSGNLMSLGALDFGLIVDGAVVVVENVVRRLAHTGRVGAGEVLEAAREVGRPVVFGVGIIIAVYLPILSLTGMEGKMFRPMALTVVFALVGSLLLSLTLVPVLASFLLRPGPAEREPFLVARARRLYRPALRWTMGRPLRVLGFSLGLFAASILSFPFLGAEFLPRLDEGAIAIQAVRLPSVSLTESVQMAARVERALLEFPEVETVVTRTGRPEIATDPMGPEISDILVKLKDGHRPPEALVEAMQERLERIPGMHFSFSQPVELRVSELIAGVRSDVALKIFGEDLPTLQRTAARAAEILRRIPGARDVKVEQVSGLPYLQIEIDRQAIARHGLKVEDVQQVVEIALGQGQAGEVFQGDRRYPLVVWLDAGYRADPESLGKIPVPLPRGGTLPLEQVARLRLETGAAQISREHGMRRIVVEANVRGRDLVGFVHEAGEAVAGVIPPGYFADWGGQFENYERARHRLALVVPVALAGILFLLQASLGSLRQALLIFFNVPLAVVGGVAALMLRGMPFSISAGVGFIALAGVAVLNGLVLVSQINQLRIQGKPLKVAVMEGATARLRPVLMTALVASLGFLPVAVSHGAGAEVQRPLATVVIGGLVSSTLLTLLVVPSLYLWLESRRSSARREGREVTR
jgi:cobalt-zinc-cadmium resistance protein CzcA